MSTLEIDRRQLMGLSLAFSGTTMASTPGRDQRPLREAMPLLQSGVWEGTYRSLKPNLDLIDQWDFRLELTVTSGPEGAYRQETHYRWPDGRERNTTIIADFVDGAVVFGDDRLSGRFWQPTADLLIAEMVFGAEPSVIVTEMMRQSADGRSRSRVGTQVRDGVLESLQIPTERRVD